MQLNTSIQLTAAQVVAPATWALQLSGRLYYAGTDACMLLLRVCSSNDAAHKLTCTLTVIDDPGV